MGEQARAHHLCKRCCAHCLGAKGVTFRRTADDLNFKYSSIDFEAAFTIDVRSRMGKRSMVTHFQTVREKATVSTDETEERLREVVEETVARCPVYNLVRDAGVNLETVWVRKSGQGPAQS